MENESSGLGFGSLLCFVPACFSLHPPMLVSVLLCTMECFAAGGVCWGEIQLSCCLFAGSQLLCVYGVLAGLPSLRSCYRLGVHSGAASDCLLKTSEVYHCMYAAHMLY